MQKSQIFNPLKHSLSGEQQQSTSSVDGANVATAAIYNEKQGECPKCKNQMITAVIASADSVFFCEKCRVSTPLADS